MILRTRRAMRLSVAASMSLFIVAHSAAANIYPVVADVSVGSHQGDNTTFTPGDPCYLTSGGTDSATDFMLLWFDLSGWPTEPVISDVVLRLTRAEIETTSDYTVRARGFHAGNDSWWS